MKTKIFFFSGTGNSLILARELAARLNHVEIFNIKNFVEQETVCGDERIGIIFPVYAMGIPLIVKRFLENLKLQGNSYIFAIANAASCYGIALEQIEELLRQKNAQLNAAFNIFMPNNYLPFGGAESEKKQQHKFSVATAKLDDIAPQIVEQVNTAIPHQWYAPRWLAKLAYAFFATRIHQEGKKFHSSSNCSGCGLCSRICPVNNIVMNDSQPIWGDKCEQCFACLQFCPQSAILRGRIPAQRRHYHHPAVKPEELF